MVASAPARKSTPAAGPEKPLLASLMDKMLSIFGADEGVRTAREHPAVLAPPAPTPAPGPALLTEIPLPPVRPAAEPAPEPPPERALVEAARAADVPPPRQADAARPAGKFALALPKIIAGAQPILPPGFTAYADLDPRS